MTKDQWQKLVSVVVCLVVMVAAVYMWRVTNTYEASLHATPEPIGAAECAMYQASGVHVQGCEWYLPPAPPLGTTSRNDCYTYKELGILPVPGCEKWGY